MPAPYREDTDYGRPDSRNPPRGREERDPRGDPRATRGGIDLRDRRPQMDNGRDVMRDARDVRMDDAIDPRMEPRLANSTARLEPRTGRPIDSRPEQEVLYRDPHTGEIYREAPRRAPYADDFHDIQPGSRPIIDPGLERGQPKPPYNEYFLPGEGIDREVIQAEICRYLGQDATCRPGRNPKDGRSGYLIRAYRALTSAMIMSLQEDSTRYSADREKQARRGQRQVPYAEMRDRNRGYPLDEDMTMDVDDRATYAAPRHARDMESRPPAAGRHGALPVSSSGYLPDPGYPAHAGYALGSGASGPHGNQYEPRTLFGGGNTPPVHDASLRPAHPSFPQSGYPPRTTQSSTASIPTTAAYRDPRTGEVSGYPQYPADSGRRHHR